LRARVTVAASGSLVHEHVVALVRSITGFVAAQSGDMSTAMVDLQVAYPAAVSTRDMPILAAVGVCTAALAQALGRAEAAAVMLGAAAKVRGSDDLTDPPVAWLTDTLRQTLGGRFAEKYAEGKGLALPRAVAALSPARLDQLAGCAEPRPAASNSATTACP
jgi:hypothetical protein